MKSNVLLLVHILKTDQQTCVGEKFILSDISTVKFPSAGPCGLSIIQFAHRRHIHHKRL